MERKTHIAVVSVPIVSHQIAISEFIKKLLNLHPNKFHITLIIPVLDSLSNASKSIIASLSSLNVDTIVLPPINLPPQTVPTLKLPLSMSLTMPYIIDALKTKTSKLVAIIADYFAYEVFSFAKKLNILSYTYFPSSATVLSLCFHSKVLDETISGEFKDLQEPIKIPGCVPIQGTDLPSSFQDRNSESYNHFLLRSKGINLCDGILVNSFVELESQAVKALIEESINVSHPPVYMVGPIIQQNCDNTQNESQCLSWLDEQKPNSVVFVSFGSGGTISQNQMNELALGLELSSQKFLWVVREPNDIASAIYFDVSNSKKDPLSFLPKGFLERTNKQGFLVSNWAPQVEILSHKAIGGFVTHCGWFSTLECVVNGVPIVAWPLFAEQRMNATILADGIKIAIRPTIDNVSGVVEKVEIVNVLKRLIVDEGIEIRRRMKVLKDAAANAMKVDGSSIITMSQLVTKWTKMEGFDEN
ncbi:putative hydroquinone glucosyltransferase [Medicago truncatula]|uniref:Putative hydroquinone glucosyltransferase n=1 Tax=Medicago truncatula TaxID=3880 RepID=G7LBM3_MEDTR|nr:hydroquinone glucosyltransferase [Medicago truncatula]AET01195.1 UDP-glucosyltransferase family protein [Medicago truncatula]RHN38591.1 putative hydroquinone glucosyltransferase [Medicago truncatula]